MTSSTAVRRAATCILVRHRDDTDEILLVKRPSRARFMASAYVFPGGKVDPQDAPLNRFSKTAAEAQMCAQAVGSVDAKTARAHTVAVIREVLEEVGIDLCRPSEDAAGLQDAWGAGRQDKFTEFLSAQGRSLDTAELYYWAHWITPSAESMRFDARFFLSWVPDSVSVHRHPTELVDSRWLSPSAALDAHERGEIYLPPPTWITLEELCAPAKLRAIRTKASKSRASARKIAPILPKWIGVPGDKYVVFPWDPEFQTYPGEALALGADDGAAHPQASACTRIQLPV